ncbi:AEC family transporter [Ornithinimicrobium cavernae]|uniref:AEC family transporter n=1 Tax=Ornithinimicrobium cavernae TaxID=2666047 RepID=UPI000D698DB1|nr:AEC family transporter [Ornithinimicrobium cavernae]
MDIVSVIIPFFALVLIGYLAARSRALPLEAVAGLNSYVLYFALSALLFQLGARTPVVELLDPVLMLLWLVAGLLVMAPAVAIARRSGRGWLDASFGGLIAVLPNSGFMGLPLIAALVGADSGGPIITSLLVDIVLMQSLAIALSQRARGGHSGVRAQVAAALSRVSRNPMPWAIVLGAAWGVTGRRLPGPLDDVLTMLAESATPVALFTIGAVLARQQMRARAAGERPTALLSGDVPWLTVLKLALHPVAVWLLGLAAIGAGLPLEESALVVLVLVAALPSATNASMLAERLGADNGRIASVILTSTALGFATFTLAVTLLV